MARGWESKAVENQQSVRDAWTTDAGEPLSPDQAARLEQLRSLQLSRARVMADLQTACRAAHRAMLETALADLDQRIRALAGNES